MKLGAMMGGQAWSQMKEHVRDAERLERKRRRDLMRKAKRRAELDAMGFRALKGAR